MGVLNPKRHGFVLPVCVADAKPAECDDAIDGERVLFYMLWACRGRLVKAMEVMEHEPDTIYTKTD